ncbi:MAG: DUF3180 domain-containing protein [Nocardioides sp.]|nr:DUF3180 domain-containing protein [Nocardioides sp.]
MTSSPEGPGHDRPEARLGPTPATLLAGVALAGVLLGGVLRPLSIRVSGTAPTVGLLQVAVLYFVAAVLAGVAWLTWRSLHRRHEYLDPHRAVNRLVLAKSCALVGALCAGGYGGYALAFVGRAEAALAQERMVNGALGAVAGLLVTLAALALERACRTRGGDPRDLP